MKGGLYVVLKDGASARFSFKKALSLSPAYFPAAENLARLDLRQKHLELAEKRYESVLAADKNNVATMTKLCNLVQVGGHPAEATTWFEKAAAENSAAVGPELALRTHYFRSSAKGKAQVPAQQVVAVNDGNTAVLDFPGRRQAANNDLSGSLLTFKKLAPSAATSVLPQIRVANMYLAMQNQAEAIAEPNKALALQPDNFIAETALIAPHSRAGELNAEMKIARQVQKQQPKEAAGYVYGRRHFDVAKKPGFAVRACERAAMQRKRSSLLIRQQGVPQGAGREKDAGAMAIRQLKDYLQDSLVQLNRAHSYLTREQPRAAIEQYEAALKNALQNSEVVNNLAFAHHKVKDACDLELAESALKLAPNSPGTVDTPDLILVEKGNDVRGLGLLQKASTTLPNNKEVPFYLATGLVKAGDKAGAKKELTILAASKTFPAAEEAKTAVERTVKIQQSLSGYCWAHRCRRWCFHLN